MSDALPLTYLARHAETAWTISRRHAGRTDLPLTAHGEAEARAPAGICSVTAAQKEREGSSCSGRPA